MGSTEGRFGKPASLLSHPYGYQERAFMNKKPNVLWLFSDEHTPFFVSCAGDPNIETRMVQKPPPGKIKARMVHDQDAP
jgi:hypothetical protein